MLNFSNGVEILHPTKYGQGISNPNEANLVAGIILFDLTDLFENQANMLFPLP